MKKSLLFLPLLTAFAGTARADLSYTQTTSSPMTAMMGAMSSKTYAKGDSSRTEASVFGRKIITLARGAKGIVQIDPATKTYTTGSQASAKSMMPKGGKAPAMNISVSTKKLGVDTVQGVKAPHWLIDMNTKVATQRGPQNLKMTMEVWSSSVPYPTSNQTRADAMKNLPDAFKSMFGKAQIKGDLKGMSAAYKNVPLRMTMSMNGRPMATINTGGISTKPLPASLFAVPAGYRAVSNAQFGQMQQAAMQKSMAGMMGRMQNR